MRRSEKLISNPEIIEQILKKSAVCRLAFSTDGDPYIVPVNFGYENNRIYIHSAQKGRKIEMIAKNNRVCFEMEMEHEVVKHEIACRWTARYMSVIGYGQVAVIHDKQQKIAGLDIIMTKYGGPEKNKYDDASLESMVLLVIEIESLTAKQSGHWDIG